MNASRWYHNSPDRPLLIGHRGSQLIEKYPENSIPAFKEAVQLGAQAIELDVQLSADRKMMVYHDDTLSRLMGIDKNLRNFSCTQLKNFRFVNSEKAEYITIPTLSEVFESFGNHIFYNIEIKSDFKWISPVIKELYKCIAEFNLQNKVWISSFDPVVLWRWHRKYSGIPLAFLFDKWRFAEKWICRQPFIDILHPGINLISHFEAISNPGKEICFWTVNSADDLQKIKRMNLLGIITDNIPSVKQIFTA